MKKIFIGLLIIAAGAGTYYFLQKEKAKTIVAVDQQELLTGKWKLDSLSGLSHDSSTPLLKSLVLLDSAWMKRQYDFQKNGKLVQLATDSAKPDTAFYEWTKKKELLWKDAPAD